MYLNGKNPNAGNSWEQVKFQTFINKVMRLRQRYDWKIMAVATENRGRTSGEQCRQEAINTLIRQWRRERANDR